MCDPSAPAQASVRVACYRHSQVKEAAFQWPCMSAHEAEGFVFFFFFMHTDTHSQKSWGRSFVKCRRISSHAPYAEGSDLRHSSGNLCPNSCGLIRLCVEERGKCRPRNYEGHPIHYTPPINPKCSHKHMQAIFFVPLYVSVAVRIFPFLCLQLLHVSCMCARVLWAQGIRRWLYWMMFSSLMAGRSSWGFVHRKAIV